MRPNDEEVWAGFVRRLSEIERFVERPAPARVPAHESPRPATRAAFRPGPSALVGIVAVAAIATIVSLGRLGAPTPSSGERPATGVGASPGQGGGEPSASAPTAAGTLAPDPWAAGVTSQDAAVALALRSSRALDAPRVLEVRQGPYSQLAAGPLAAPLPGRTPATHGDRWTWRVALVGRFESTACGEVETCDGRETVLLDAATGSVVGYELVAPAPGGAVTPGGDSPCGTRECP